MTRPQLCVVAFGLGLALLGCGLEEIELRSNVETPPPPPGPREGSVPEPETALPRAGIEGREPVAPVDAAVKGAAPSPDAPLNPELPQLPEIGCEKIDFLFVVDNSLSMLEEQAKLRIAFPGFLARIRESFVTQDSHVMVVDTDGPGDDDASGAECERALGAGHRLTWDGQECGVQGAARYMVQSQPNLEQTFACLTEVGNLGDGGEQTMGAMLTAIGPEQEAERGCNAGFLRRDALLVVVVVTDGDDSSDGNPESWKQRLLDAKGGSEDAVVVLGLAGDEPTEVGVKPCRLLLPEAQPAPRLHAFVDSLTFGRMASVCWDDYSWLFGPSISVIAEACTHFVPAAR